MVEIENDENNESVKQTKTLKDLVKVSRAKGQVGQKIRLNERAQIFKENIEKDLAENPNADSSGARYDSIYKNLIRELR